MKIILLTTLLLVVNAYSQEIINLDKQLILNSTGGGNGGEFSEARLSSSQVLVDKSLKQIEIFLKERSTIVLSSQVDSLKALEILNKFNFIVNSANKNLIKENNIYIAIADIDEVSSSELGLYQYILDLIIDVSSLE